MKKTDWTTIKTWYVQGEQGSEGLRYPTLDELAKRSGRNDSAIRKVAAKEKWAEQRKQFTAKVENLTAEKKSTVMAGESVEFDSEVLRAARKGIQLINDELDKAVKTNLPDSATSEEVIDFVVAKKQAISSFGKALTDYQKAGKLAFGENPEPDKPVTINVKYDK